MRKLILPLMALAVIAAAAVSTVSPAFATKGGGHPITICHRTDSNTNPYVVESPDANSTKFAGHEGHTGPVWDATLKAQHIKWGDIIPPTSNDGLVNVTPLNWDAAGQAIFNNGCAPVPPVVEPGTFAPSASLSGGTCDTQDVTVNLDNTGSANGTDEQDESAVFNVTVDGQPVDGSPFTVAAGASQSLTLSGLTDGQKVEVTVTNSDDQVVVDQTLTTSLDCGGTPPPPPPPPPPGGGGTTPPPSTGGGTVVTAQAVTL